MIKNIIYFLVFLASTIGFVVLFESGPENYGASFEKKIKEISALVTGKSGEKKPGEKKP